MSPLVFPPLVYASLSFASKDKSQLNIIERVTQAMPFTIETVIGLIHANIVFRSNFALSIFHLQNKKTIHSLRPLSDRSDAVQSVEKPGGICEGDCHSPLSLPEGGCLHIVGCLLSDIESHLSHEIVIGGDVEKDATIRVSGPSHIFIGGNFNGKIISSGSAAVWIEKNFNGTVIVGDAHLDIHIGLDCTGNFGRLEDGGSLWLTVGGFASSKLLSEIAGVEFRHFRASVMRSDAIRGVYPPIDCGDTVATMKHRPHEWCVRTGS